MKNAVTRYTLLCWRHHNLSGFARLRAWCAKHGDPLLRGLD
jgi:hypothetical protein